MRRAALLALAAALALGAAVPAGGQSGGAFLVEFGGPPGFRVTQQVAAPLTVSGEVSISYTGPGISGSTVWRAPSAGELDALRFRTRHGGGTVAAIDFGTGESGVVTSAHVERTDASGAVHTCADVMPSRYGFISTQSRSSSVTISLRGKDLDVVTTRCAGPVERDIAPLLPAVPVRYAQLRRGSRTIGLSARRPFSAGGLTGTVSSTLVLREGVVARRQSPPGPSPAPRGGARHRLLNVDYRVERLDGTVTTDVAGAADPAVCGPLDACGLGGTLTLTQPAAKGSVSLFADVAARHSSRSLRAAFGLVAGRPAPGAHPVGAGTLTSRAGTLTAALARPDGACTDTVPERGGDIELDIAGGRLHVNYLAADAASGPDPLRTRCPGPTLADVAGRGAVASGSVPLGALRAATVTVHLTHGVGFDAGAWAGRTRPDLTLVLHRSRVSENVQREPGFPSGG